MDLSTIILPEHVFVGLPAPTKWRALQMLSSKAGSCFGLDEAMVLRVLEAREKLGTTGIGNGVAVPHAAVAGMTRPRGLMVRFAHAVDFEAIDDVPTEWAFVLLFGEGGRSDYLNVLAAVARRLRTEGVLTAMRQAKNADELYSVFMSDSIA
ncbi:PTS transporter subunit EIIA [Rhizobium sp. P40RR-XXII]|uniref:PTS sugar transporter subunit IIA n=1 Tax=unclassified Rhizobium TaxID=2613769 RepID=UPI0014572AA5|nr:MULTISPECIES: PTS sugar transporter subunit IIA [unclassified Rhizobium]NLR86731.1 PTS transporter subunit EIIA [Rhizobium sp. P28RR-XV]NLS17403.1 PTS transporter subunit EIIA [Rhizobium sp. P40RR-XXII]